MQVVPHTLNPVLQLQAVPAPLQVEFGGHVPQLPPQPSLPQILPLQDGVQLD
jgi:hypothetical protein